jgi:hypothetical protein
VRGWGDLLVLVAFPLCVAAAIIALAYGWGILP